MPGVDGLAVIREAAGRLGVTVSGIDTALKVAKDMRDAYGDRFYVHQGMEELVGQGNLGAKSGKGFYEHGS